MKTIFAILLYVWQLPQNLVGLFLRLFYPNAKREEIAGVKVFYDPFFYGGISLGNTIFVSSRNEMTVLHEHGHQIQSMYLGPLYLLVIGLPSLIWASMYGTVIKRTHNGYYHFYTERWADRLGGVIRN